MIRRVCENCAEPYKANAAEIKILRLQKLDATNLRRGRGCALCRNTGYRERIAAFQILESNDFLGEFMISRPQPSVFRQHAIDTGMTTMDYEALRLASEGLTTIEEALTLAAAHDIA